MISYGFLTSAENGHLALHEGFFMPISENPGLVFGGPKGVSPPLHMAARVFLECLALDQLKDTVLWP